MGTQDWIPAGELHLRLLERYAPPSVVVTEEHHVVHMSETVGRFMQVPPGEPTRDLLQMVRPDLRPDLRTALHKAVRERVAIEVGAVGAVPADGGHHIAVTVHPVLRESDPLRGYLLVTFEEKGTETADQQEWRKVADPAEPVATRLEEELAKVRLQLRATIEQYEMQLEENKAANEKLRMMQADFEARLRERTHALEAEVSARASAHHHVSGLLKKIVTAQEDERARIARDLHDQLGQQLTALRLALEQYRDRVGEAGPTAPELQQALKLTAEVDREVDFLAWELRPAILDDLGLAAALPRYIRQWSSHYGIAAEYRGQGFRGGLISRDAEVVFYRVAQEALNNIIKHAHASRVDVLLESRDSAVVLVVEDNGIGFDPVDNRAGDPGIGLVGMRERAATIGAELQVESAPGDGTSIFLRARTLTPTERAEKTP